jgi:hypothetical protein
VPSNAGGCSSKCSIKEIVGRHTLTFVGESDGEWFPERVEEPEGFRDESPAEVGCAAIDTRGVNICLADFNSDTMQFGIANSPKEKETKRRTG